MPRIADISALTRSARERQAEQFIAAWPGFYLICAPSEAPPVQFITEPAEPNALNLKTPTRTRFEVHHLAKARGQPFGDRISLGRARNCDIVLRHPSVSKLHAHFRLDSESIAILDNSSRNGTAVNDTKLIPERRVLLQSGDRVRVGTIETILYDAADLYQFLR